MYTIRNAEPKDAARINAVTKKAFALYRDELHSATPVKALGETDDTVKEDILHRKVFVAEQDGEILGAIRYCGLSDKLAYIFRFGVDPDINNLGIGSDLLKRVIDDCEQKGFAAIALHTNSKYYRLARYYYGKQFFVHSTSTEKGYIRALFVKELNGGAYDVTPAFKK
jgi:predicted N-acetyltransferase YhbS